MGVTDHSQRADREIGAVRCAVLTISDSRTAKTDESGRLASGILTGAGHQVSDGEIVPNDRVKIAKSVKAALAAGADLVVAIGGTGVSKRDVTVDAVRDLVEKELPGFGELFRMMTAREIGTAAILTRASLGATADGRLIAVTPGSPAAVRLALEEILVPQLKHLLSELRRTS